MNVYLSSPNSQLQASHVANMPVLLSYAIAGTKGGKWVEQYVPSFSRILIDSGAYSEFNTGKKIDLGKYIDWSARWEGHADAIAGLDDIAGDWRKSLANFERFPRGFPTFHDTDPWEFLPDLIAMARERRRADGRGWIGLGLKPPRGGKEAWVRRACDLIPDDLHVHGWALREYTQIRRLDSVDSCNWFMDSWKILSDPNTRHLTPSEALEIVVKRYARENRVIVEPDKTRSLFDMMEAG